MRRFGVALCVAGLALVAWPGSAVAQRSLSRAEQRDLRLYDATLVLARPAAGPALRRAGGVRIATVLPIWRLRSGPALRVVPGLMRDGLVRAVDPDRPLSVANHLGDPLVPQEWWIPFVGADRAEPPGAGKPVTVIDTGVDLTHVEFAGRPATTALNGQSTSARLEEHGTAVASVVAAPTNGTGLVGVYPQAALQIWDASPLGIGIRAGDVINGLDAAIRRGPGVVNLSLGSQVRNPLLDAMIAYTISSGTLVVAAAGNSGGAGSPLEYPASLPHVLTVGAIDQSGQPTAFSSRSPYVDLAAPGLNIPIAVPATFSGTGYSTFSGTSFSSPMVAGAAAWIWTARPTLDVTQLFDVMRASAQDISSPGFDPLSGFGRLDIPAALAVAPVTRDPQEPNEDVSYLKRNGLLHRASTPLTAASRPRGTVGARVEFAEDPRDVYRIWVPGRHTAFVALQPSGGDVDLALWGPRTVSVLEGGGARRRDFRGLSERRGRKRESLRVKNTGRRGAYYYAEASVGAGSGTAARRVAGISYGLSVSVVKTKSARR
ncbi:MAG TPA: S8 family serine peptidase [Gaiellaceae bacterium]